MNKIKFGIIGYGNIGKRHAQHIIKHPEAILTSVCEVAGFEFEAELPPTIQRYDSVEVMLQQGDIDVVNVCTPNYLHHPHTLMSLEHGKHVVCEKPMAMSSIECADMIQKAKQVNKTIFVVKQNRYNAPVQQVRNLLLNQQLGKVFMVQVNCFWNRNEYYYQESAWRGKKKLDGGCLFTQFSHFVDILFYLFGEISSCQGVMNNFHHPYTEVEDSGSFIMQTTQGVMVNFNFSTCSYERNMEGAITILAEYGTIKIGGQYLNTIEYQQIKNVVLPQINIQAKSNDYGKYQGSMSNHDLVIDNVVQTLKGKAEVMTNAGEGKKVIDIIELMYINKNNI